MRKIWRRKTPGKWRHSNRIFTWKSEIFTWKSEISSITTIMSRMHARKTPTIIQNKLLKDKQRDTDTQLEEVILSVDIFVVAGQIMLLQYYEWRKRSSTTTRSRKAKNRTPWTPQDKGKAQIATTWLHQSSSDMERTREKQTGIWTNNNCWKLFTVRAKEKENRVCSGNRTRDHLHPKQVSCL